MQGALKSRITTIATSSNAEIESTGVTWGIESTAEPQTLRLQRHNRGRTGWGLVSLLALVGCSGGCGRAGNPSHSAQALPTERPAERPAAQAQAQAQVEGSSELEVSVRPDVNERFLDPALNVQEFVEVFETESREIALLREELADSLQLQAGERVADLGAGTGLFMDPLCDRVGTSGLVWALEISTAFVEHLEQRANEHKLDMLRPRLVSERSVDLEPNSVDAVFVCDTYHHFEYPASVLSSLRDALRPGGRLVIVDFERDPGSSRAWVLRHVRCGKAQTRAEVEAAGFVFDAEVTIEGLTENYVLRFRNPQ